MPASTKPKPNSVKKVKPDDGLFGIFRESPMALLILDQCYASPGRAIKKVIADYPTGPYGRGFFEGLLIGTGFVTPDGTKLVHAKEHWVLIRDAIKRNS